MKVKGLRVLITVHGSSPTDRRRTGLGVGTMNTLVDRWTAVSPSLAEHMALHWRIPAGKIVTIANGIDVDRFRAYDPALRAATRSSLGVSTDEVMCLAVGRLSPDKDYPHMLHAFSAAQKHDKRLKLRIAGEGLERTALERQIQALGLTGQVTLLGLREDILRLLQASDIFLMSSLYEGLSKATTEAMAAARPVVATNAIGMRDLIEDGETGFLLPSGDCDGFAGAILRLAQDPSLREQFGRQGRAKAERRFSSRTMIEQYEHLYEELLELG